MDLRIVAAVLTILLLAFPAHDKSPSDAVVGPDPGARGVASSSPEGKVDPNDRQDPAILPLEPGTRATVNETARIRRGPGTTYPIVTKVSTGARLNVLARHEDWYQVRLSDGRPGWIAGFLLLPGGRAPAAADVPKPQGAGSVRVLGYYTEDYPRDLVSYRSLERRSGALDYVATFLYGVDAGGRVTGSPSERVMKVVESGGVQALALVHNLGASGFDAGRAHALLRDASSRARAVSDILDILKRGKYRGVNVDLENVSPSDRDNLTAFVRGLAANLRPRGYLVTMSVPAKTADHAASKWVGAFDYYALGRECDLVMIMSYDEHARTSGPGPVASYGWVERVVKYAITQVPRHKILLGVPAYGYDWNLATGGVTALSYAQVMSRAKRLGITPSWDEASKSPHFRYTENGATHEVWFESPSSAGPKLDLVKRYGLGGIAVWKLGYEGDEFWEVIDEKLRAG